MPISAILGERTYRDVIRTGAPRAFVSAVFSGIPELAWFGENQVEYDADELLIQREIYPDGKNVCRVNGRPVTVSILKRLGVQLISIHGQHDRSSFSTRRATLPISICSRMTVGFLRNTGKNMPACRG